MAPRVRGKARDDLVRPREMEDGSPRAREGLLAA